MLVAEILSQIKSTSGSNAKKDLLKEHIENNNLKTALKMGLDPFTPFHVVKVPKVKNRLEFPLNEDASWKEFFAVANRCANREITGNSAVDALQ